MAPARGGAAPASTRGEAAETAERVVELLRARVAGADGEVIVRRGSEALTRFANSVIHQNVASETAHVALRVALDGRTAAASLDGPDDDEALGRLVDGVLEAARVRPVDPDWPGVAEPAPAPTVDHWDEATADADPDARARLVAGFVAAAGGLETAGFCSTTERVVAFADTAGQRLAGRTTLATIDGIARTGTSDGSGRASSIRLADLDGGSIGDRAARHARDAADPTDLAPGRYEVVLSPDCVADILSFLYTYGFGGRAVEEGRSFVRLGEARFDPSITLSDDVTAPGSVGLPFDDEGTPKRPVDLIRAGVTVGVLHTRRTAAKVGTAPTGHALEGGEDWGFLMADPVLSVGDRPTETLVAGIERGLLVTDLHYTRILDPRTQVVTGLTRNGVWLVEDGRIARPVRNLRFTQSYVDALAPGAVLGIGGEAVLVAGEWGSGSLVPSLHLAGWNFTGGARG